MATRNDPNFLGTFSSDFSELWPVVGRVEPNLNPIDVHSFELEDNAQVTVYADRGTNATIGLTQFVTITLAQDTNNNNIYDPEDGDTVLAESDFSFDDFDGDLISPDTFTRLAPVFTETLSQGTFFIEVGDDEESTPSGTDLVSVYNLRLGFTDTSQQPDNSGGDQDGNQNSDLGDDDTRFQVDIPDVGLISFFAPQPTNSFITNVVLNTNEAEENELVITELPQSIQALGTDAAFENQMGLYVMVNEDGGVIDEDGTILLPGDDGYASAALANAVDDFLLRGGSGVNTTPEEFGETVIPSDSLIGTFLISNGGNLSVEEFIEQNPDNIIGENFGDPVAYFGFAEANPDGRRHLRSLGNNTFGWEDLPNNGDADFNDLIFSLDFSVQV